MHRAYPGMLEKAALAHIAIGFAQRRPSLVRLAEKMVAYAPVGAPSNLLRRT